MSLSCQESQENYSLLQSSATRGFVRQHVGDFNDENALKVAVKRFCCVTNLIRHVSTVAIPWFPFCN